MPISLGIWILSGFIADILLYYLLKKRKESENVPANMIPWKSSNESEQKIQIPLNASYISFFNMVMVIFLRVVIRRISLDKEWVVLISQFLCRTVFSVYLPIVLYLTVKQKRVKDQKTLNAQPPKQLNFHAENESESQEENQICEENFLENNEHQIEMTALPKIIYVKEFCPSTEKSQDS